MWSRDEDGLSADAVHVDAGARLQVIEVNVAVFGNKENHVLLGAYLYETNTKQNVYKCNDSEKKSNTRQVLLCSIILSLM